MTAERTALESALIPVTAYILISGVECYRRYPDLMAAIAAAKSPAEIGAAGRRPGNQVDAVHLWSIANIALVGRQLLAPFGMIDPGRRPRDARRDLQLLGAGGRGVPRPTGTCRPGTPASPSRATDPT